MIRLAALPVHVEAAAYALWYATLAPVYVWHDGDEWHVDDVAPECLCWTFQLPVMQAA